MASLPAALRILGLLAVGPPVADSLARMALARAAGTARGSPALRRDVKRWLVVVPARGEGAAVREAIESVAEAAEEAAVVTLLLLDGPDAEAERAGRDAGARALVKEPAGPTKGAALAWLVRHHPEVVDAADAVLIVDVGSRLSRGFFAEVAWPEDAGAVQAWLRGVGRGVGDAVILSEALAQGIEDRGRQALGWNVHLRGTGTAYRPEVFRRIVPALKTAVEDTEATLLLAAEGERTAMMGPGAVVEDVKPSEMGVAASQRSRWLLGELALLFRQPGTLFRLLARRPAEGLSFLAGLLSRPLALSGALRVFLAGCFLADAVISGAVISWVAAALLAATLVGDLVLLRRATDMPWPRLAAAGARLVGVWVGAVLLLPRAALGWVRGRK